VKYPHILRTVYETPWAILPERLATILAVLHERASGYTPTLEQIEARLALHETDDHEPSAGPQQPRISGTVAVLPVLGILTQRGGMTGASEPLTSTARLMQAFRSLVADETVGAIVMDVDSPGGSVFGTLELADEIYRARGSKPIVAVANSMAASAAYWIATAADELVVTPSGEVGSIGVIAAHEDISAALEQDGRKVTLITAGKYKGEGNPYEPLGEEARAAIQATIDDYYAAFVSAVARHRGVKAGEVRGGFGEGRMVSAKDAVSLGMADRVGTLDEVLGGFARGRRGAGTRAEAGIGLKRRRLEMHGALTPPAVG
jgi:capsid assembly protease